MYNEQNVRNRSQEIINTVLSRTQALESEFPSIYNRHTTVEILKRVADNLLSLADDLYYNVSDEIKELAKEIGYTPNRRYENRAGFEQITYKQQWYVIKLMEDNPELGDKIVRVIEAYWKCQWVNEWTKADAAFAINKLLVKK